METLMAQTTGDTHTQDFKDAQPATSHTVCAYVRVFVCACMRVCVSVHAEMRGSTDPERIGRMGGERGMRVWGEI